MCLLIHVLKCSVEDSFKVEHTTHPGVAGAADGGGCDRGLWVGCRVSGRQTANYHGNCSVVGCSLAGGYSAPPLPPPPLGARCPLSHLLARDGLCVE